jgi:hypothetical protein
LVVVESGDAVEAVEDDDACIWEGILFEEGLEFAVDPEEAIVAVDLLVGVEDLPGDSGSNSSSPSPGSLVSTSFSSVVITRPCGLRGWVCLDPLLLRHRKQGSPFSEES